MSTILVADDNPVSRELIREILEAGNFHVVEASDGREALNKLENAMPDLVLLDIQMPGMDGFAVLRQLRQDSRYGAMPVAALTAYAMHGDRERALAAGFDDYITKPISAGDFRSRIQKLLH
jgi:two-component system cell cycle response regulator DivK